MTTPPRKNTARSSGPDDAHRFGRLVLAQLTDHYESHLRPRLEGLSDDEYRFEPVAGCWSIRPRADARSPMAAGAGEMVADFEFPEPDPAPFTTIAWRLAHVTIGVFAMRNAWHFGAPAVDYQSAHYPAGAAEAIGNLDQAYGVWVKGVSSFTDKDLARPVGPVEPFLAGAPFAALVLHIHREAIHHLAEVLVLRDLYRAQR